MGLGRSVGFTDGIRKALRVGKDAADGFSEQIAELLAYFDGKGPVRARPSDGLHLPAFVLAVGSGAEIAAEHGLPLVIGAARDEQRMLDAIAAYRATFRPSSRATGPYVMVAANVAVADSAERAARLQAPEAWATAVSRTQGAFTPLLPPGDVPERTMTERERSAYDAARASQLHGTADGMTSALAALTARTGADELLLTLNTHDPADRLDSYRRLAHAIGLVTASAPPAASANAADSALTTASAAR